MTELTPQHTPPEHHTSWWAKTLKAAGLGYMVGDISMVMAGLARRGESATKWKGTVGGAIVWFVGGIAAAIWGNPNPEKQLEIQASKLEQHLVKKGADISDDVRAQSPLLKKKSWLGRVSELFYQRPSELLNTMYGIGSLMLLHDGLKASTTKPFLPRKFSAEGLTKMNTDFWIGAVILAGAITGLAVKEDPDARKKAEGKGPLQRAYAYVAEKPLRVTGALYGLNNVFLGAKAFQDYHGRNTEFAGKSLKPHQASMTQFTAYVFSNLMLLLSRRDQITQHFSSTDIGQLEDTAARIVAAQSPEKQQALLTDMANYMATQKGITMKAPEIAQHLAERISTLTHNRVPSSDQHWTQREELRAQSAEMDATPPLPR